MTVGMTNREILEVLYDRSERVEHALFGNGQEGLLARVARLEVSRPVVKGGALGTGVVALVLVVARLLGIDLPV